MEKTMPHSTVFAPITLIDYAEGSIISRQLTKNSVGNITLFSFDQGQEISEHQAPFDAVITIIEGVACIRIDGHTYTLSQGDMIIMPANIPHAVSAQEGRFKMILTMIRGN